MMPEASLFHLLKMLNKAKFDSCGVARFAPDVVSINMETLWVSVFSDQSQFNSFTRCNSSETLFLETNQKTINHDPRRNTSRDSELQNHTVWPDPNSEFEKRIITQTIDEVSAPYITGA